jgi:predicted ATPase
VKDSTFLSRVIIRNYKSIESCDVELGPLTFLVGPNGAGKSNFLDALSFVADALYTTLDHAIRDRGGVNDVRRRSGGHPTHFGMRLEFRLDSGLFGSYYFKIGARPHGAYEVQEEECLIWYPGEIVGQDYFQVRSGEVITNLNVVAPAALPDRLYLVNASYLAQFRPVYEAFSRMGFYNLDPDQLRQLQPADVGELLAHDGRNIASVLDQMASHSPKAKQRIEEYLSKIVPGLHGVDTKKIGTMETIEFRQSVAGSTHPWSFLSNNMSDGTLRALGILVALFQVSDNSRARIPLVGIEEPEMALHPAATGVLIDGLFDASEHRQILVTSHSPDLLDDERIDSILSVVAEEGATKIDPITEAGHSVIRERLYTPGELLRLNQLTPDRTADRVIRWNQMSLHLPGEEESK